MGAFGHRSRTEVIVEKGQTQGLQCHFSITSDSLKQLNITGDSVGGNELDEA